MKDHPFHLVFPLFKAPAHPRDLPHKPKGSGGVCRGDAGAPASVHHSLRERSALLWDYQVEKSPAGYMAFAGFY